MKTEEINRLLLGANAAAAALYRAAERAEIALRHFAKVWSTVSPWKGYSQAHLRKLRKEAAMRSAPNG